MRTVKKTSVFPAPREEVFQEIQKLSTLQYIASPYATFTPVEAEQDLVWSEGSEYDFRFRLFGILPMGIHRIRIKRFDRSVIASKEGNPFVPRWDHTIYLKEVGSETEYTDEVDIDAGWKTLFVYLWAKAFYAHRQRRWVTLLTAKKSQ